MKIKEYLEKNPELVRKVKECKSKDELEKLLRDNNINLSYEEVERIYNYLNNTELGEDALDSVAGGAVKSTGKDTWANISKENLNGKRVLTLNEFCTTVGIDPNTKEGEAKLLELKKAGLITGGWNGWVK